MFKEPRHKNKGQVGYKDKFGGTAKVKISERGEYFAPGDYEIEIKRCKLFTSREKDEFYIVETKVIEATKTGQRKLEKKIVDGKEIEVEGEEYVPSPAGSDRNWMVEMGTDSTDGNLAGLALAVLGVDKGDKAAVAAVQEHVPDLLAESLCDDTDPECKNSFAGKRLHLRVKMTKTKKGQPFSAHDWSPSKSPAQAPAK